MAEVALVQAKLVDDPTSPYFPAVKRLLQIRELAAARDMNRGALKNTIDEALLSLPGELEKRTAEHGRSRARPQADGRERHDHRQHHPRRRHARTSSNELAEIARLLSGTLEEQTDGAGAAGCADRRS